MKKLAIFLVVVAAAFFLSVFLFHYEEKEVYTAPITQKSTTTKPLLFAGDIMLGRYVESLARNEGNPSRSFEKVADFLKEHTAIANLEGPIPEKHTPTLVSGMSFSFASSTPQTLKEGGISAVSLANNHMFDRGNEGYEETKRALAAEGIAHFGGYSPTGDYFEADVAGMKTVVFGFTMISSQWDEEKALQIAQSLEEKNTGAYLIAFMHWGDEYVTQHRYQRDFAHKLIDLGADAVIGAHPHVVQGIEVYNGKPIFYSLGNFIFDQYWRKDLENGLLVRMVAEPRGYRYDLIPIHSRKSIPYIATSTKRDEILSSVAKQSDPLLKESILSGSLEIRK